MHTTISHVVYFILPFVNSSTNSAPIVAIPTPVVIHASITIIARTPEPIFPRSCSTNIINIVAIDISVVTYSFPVAPKYNNPT